MAMTNNYGLNFAAKNRVRRLKKAGWNNAKIAKATRATEELVSRYLQSLNKKAEPVERQASKTDEFGPLPDTPEWKKLSPTDKGRLTRQRNMAELEQEAPAE